MPGVTIRLDGGLHEQLRRVAFEKRKSINAIMVEAVEDWLRREEKKGSKKGVEVEKSV